MNLQKIDFRSETPPGEDRQRSVCSTCGFVDYVNPRIVVGSVVVSGEGSTERVLLCRRDRAEIGLLDPSGRLHGNG